MSDDRIWALGRSFTPYSGIELRAGPLSMVFESETAFLRRLRLGNTEVLRGIYAAVRDRNWDTVAPEISDLEIDREAERFRIRFNVLCEAGAIRFRWRGEIDGDPEGAVRFSFSGRAITSFYRNRIGFCVLHPVEGLSGRPCRIERADGSIAEERFPRHISPHQLFRELRAITHEVRPGVSAEVRMLGDVFETEDQRNWTDASFKTFCTPLSLPFPVLVEAGEVIEQAVEVRMTRASETPLRVVPVAQDPVFVGLSEDRRSELPEVGLGCDNDAHALSARELARLRSLAPSHLRVDLYLSDDSWVATLAKVDREAKELGTPLELAVFVTDRAEEELRLLREHIERLETWMARLLLFHERESVTDSRWVRVARDVLRKDRSALILGAGTNAYFAELNRHRPADGLDCVCFSINPQVHAFDEVSLVETLEAQGMTVQSARRFASGAEIVVSPVTLRPRFNPNATGPAPPPPPGELPPEVDRRQVSLFGAGWTLGSVKALAEAGAAGVTYYEATGWGGVMEREAGSPLPTHFSSLPGTVFPLYHVLADVRELSGGEVLTAESSDPHSVTGLFLRKGGRRRLILANLRFEARTIRLKGLRPGDYELRRLDLDTVRAAMESPEDFRSVRGVSHRIEDDHALEIPGFGLATLDPTDRKTPTIGREG